MTSQVFTGTAAGHDDLLDVLIAAVTNVSLGAEAWTQLELDISIADERILYLQGPGLAASDEINVNIRQFKNDASDYFNWQARGAVAYNVLEDFDTQPGTSPPSNLPLWDSSIPYWIIVNGRRFILIAKVSTTYHTLYAGFTLPYATSAEMPYPIFIGTSASAAVRWSDGTYRLGSFWDPTDDSCYLRHFDGAWVTIANYNDLITTQRQELTSNVINPFEKDYFLGVNDDGTYGLIPAVIHANYSGGNVYGELEGVFFVSGFSNAAEDIVEIGADDYLVVQSAYRTGRRDYAAILLG